MKKLFSALTRSTQPSEKSPIELARTIEITELRMETAQFTFRGSNKALFEDLSLDLPVGKNVWVTGANGAGQGTFLKLLSLVAPLSSGSYFINNEDVSQMTFEEFLPLRLKIGYTFDFGGLFSNKTLLENLTLPLVYHKVCDQEQAEVAVRKLANRFRFMGQLSQRPATVSGGLRKLVCILRATLLSPELLIMDDPFTAIDQSSAQILIELIKESRSAGTLKHVFLTSRDESWIEKLDPELLVIEHGFVAHYGSKSTGYAPTSCSQGSKTNDGVNDGLNDVANVSSNVSSNAEATNEPIELKPKKRTGDAA